MQEILRIESSHMTYHLESLGSLLFKTEDGKYALSSLGEAAVSMMCHVEEPPKTTLHLLLPSKRWKALSVALMVGLILSSSLCYFQYQTLTQLSSQFLSLKEERELLQEVLREALDLGDAVLTYEYTENSTVATALLMKNETLGWHGVRAPWGSNIDSYYIYSLTGNSTLEMRISFPPPDQPEAYLSIMVGKEVRVQGIWIYSVTHNGTTTSHYYNESIYYAGIWLMGVTNSSTYSVILPSRGWYMIYIGAPCVLNVTDHYIINYTITLQVKGERNYIPFFFGSRRGGFGARGFFGEYPFRDEWIPERIGDP